MSIVETITNNLDDMTRSERQVATHYLGHASDFAFCTLDGIAARVDTSSTSVLRFCRRLGFEGFKDFQQAVRLQLHGLPELPDKFHRTIQNRDEDSLFARTVAQDIRCLHESLQALSPEALSQSGDEAFPLPQLSGSQFLYRDRRSFWEYPLPPGREPA